MDGDPARRPDHPRSRGVYAVASITGAPPAGSSPLARGLLRWVSAREARARIIPARAGFTDRTSGSVAVAGDHPRSRGVYRAHRTRLGGLEGSSPLARGLRSGGRGRSSAPGIIPARAGFTPGGDRAPEGGADHPRSRGVYHPGERRVRHHLRIIPARAGFTARPRGPGRRGSDHPRSRGVYAAWTKSTKTRRGSSPLARGLRRPAQSHR